MSLVGRLFAGVIVCGALLVGYLGFDWSWTGDWVGYWLIYRDSGSWLLDSGRDPAFVLLMKGAQWVFGSGGYDSFRTTLFGYFMLTAAWLVWRAPRQHVSPSALAVVVCIAAVLPLKALVQVREGIAFTIALIALYPLFIRPKVHPAIPLSLLFLASQIHVGLLSLLLVAGLTYPFGRLLRDTRWTQVMPILSFIVGCGLGILLMRYPGIGLDLFSDDGTSLEANFQSNVLKIAYWALQAVAVFVLSQRLQEISAAIPNPRGRMIARGVAAWLLPCVYALAATLVILGFPYGAITSLAMRLLATAMEASLIFLMWRGEVGGKTLGVGLFLLANKTRNLLFVLGF